MKQLGSIIDWGHPGQPPAAIMSRFLPKLFLRRAETDISTISRLQAGKFLPSGIQDPPTQRCLQLCPQIVPNYSEGGGESQSLYFAFKRGVGIHNQGLFCIVDLQESRNGVCVEEKVNIVRERGWHPIYHTSTIWPLSTNKGGEGTCGVLFAPSTTPQFSF